MLHAVDWVIIGLYFLLSAAIGVYFTRRAGSSIQEFFLSGRNLPWWLAGTSMVATTFAADTPLAVTELVAKNGIAGNWLWWNFVLGGVLTVFFFARLWRRAGILTDVEFVELRYSGKPAAFLRGFRALYLGLFINTIIIGWVNLAMASVLEGMFGIPPGQVMIYVALSLGLTALYSALSGLWGVAVTDVFQFVLAMTGTIVLAVFVLDLPQIGGMAGLLEKVPGWSLSFFPAISQDAPQDSTGTFTLSAGAFFAFVGIQWWACWYPGAEPGGGGYVAQRMMSAKDERHSLFATLWFTVAHYCVRPWPWIIVGLATWSSTPISGLPKSGWATFMRCVTSCRRVSRACLSPRSLPPICRPSPPSSTGVPPISSMISTGVSSGLTQTEKRLVAVSRVATMVLMALSLWVTSILETISGAWAFLIEAGAGLGLVLILRWFWWRINAWSEIAAMVTPLVVYGWLHFATQVRFPETLYYIVAATTAAWIVVTFATKPTDAETLSLFYRRVHPGGAGWRALAEMHPDVKGDSGYGRLLRDWFCGTILVYSVLFGVGQIILLRTGQGLLYLAVAGVAAWIIWRDMAKQDKRVKRRIIRGTKRVLSFGTHPDDIEIGCGGTEAILAQKGYEITHAILTSGEAGSDRIAPCELSAVREKEAIEAAKVIGACGVEFLKYPDGLTGFTREMKVDIIRIIRRLKPHILFVHERNESSLGHRVASELVLESMQAGSGPWFQEAGGGPWSPEIVLGYEVWHPLGRYELAVDIGCDYGNEAQGPGLPPFPDGRGSLRRGGPGSCTLARRHEPFGGRCGSVRGHQGVTKYRFRFYVIMF